MGHIVFNQKSLSISTLKNQIFTKINLKLLLVFKHSRIYALPSCVALILTFAGLQTNYAQNNANVADGRILGQITF